MQKFFDVIQARTGDALAGVTVTVYNSAGNLATLYSDNGVTVKANPTTTNADGEYSFYAANGTYSVSYNATGYVAETRTGIVLFDPAQSTASSNISYNQGGTGAVTRTVLSKLQESVSVKDFGAVGDGTTNDTTAIQNAINSLTTGGTLFFPNGEYKVTASLTVTTNNIWLQGDLNARIKRYGAIEIFNITGSYNKISNLRLMGNKASYPYPVYARAAIVIIQGDFNNIIENQIEDGNSHGILFRTGGAAQFNLAQSNIVLNCEEAGIAHDGGVDNRILGNHISGCGFEGITLDQSSYRCIVDSNRLNNNCISGGVGGIGVDFTDLCVISNNVITASGTLSGITFQNNIGSSNYNVISGNVFDENTQYGIWLKNGTGGACSDNVISGNVFRTAGSVKIDGNCQRNILSSNSYATFPDVNTNSYCRVDNGLVNFYAVNSIVRSNVTGDGTSYVVPFNSLVQNRNITNTSSFNLTTGIFTSPITANYTFSAGIELSTATTTGNSVLIELITTSGTFSNVYKATGEDVFGGTVSASFFLKRGETTQVRVTISGGIKNFSVTNNVNTNFFTGVLIG